MGEGWATDCESEKLVALPHTHTPLPSLPENMPVQQGCRKRAPALVGKGGLTLGSQGP